MALFDTLKTILTPYAEKINKHTTDVSILSEDVNSLNGSLDAVVVRNLAKNTTWITGKGIQAATGSSYDSTNTTVCTGFIDISKCSRIMYMRRFANQSYTPISGMAFYNANQKFISGVPEGYKSGDTIPKVNTSVVPKNAVYARFTYTSIEETLANYPFFVYDADLYEAALETKVKQNTEDISAHYNEFIGSLEDLNKFLISVHYPIDGPFSIGGVGTTTGKTNNATNRVRIGYTSLQIGKVYNLQLSNDNYVILNAWLYSSNSESNAVRNLTSYIKNRRYLTFVTEQNENYIRVTFKRLNDESDMTDNDVSIISSATNLSEFTDTTLTKKGFPADSFSTGKAIKSIESGLDELSNILNKTLPFYIMDWKKFKQEQSPLGWGIGYYNAETGVGNSSSNNYIRTRNRMDTDMVSENTTMCCVTPPSGYYVLVCVTNKSDGGFVETLNADRSIDKTIYFTFDKTKRYGFTIGAFNGDSADFVTEEFVNTVELRIYERAKSGHECYLDDLTRDYIWESSLEYALMLPNNYNPIGDPTKLIICGHGLSSTIDANSWGAKNVSSKFVEQGYAVMDVNCVTSQDWCNPALIKKYIRAINDIVSKYNVTPTFVYGFSMGSLIGLTLSTIIPGIKANVISGIRLDFLARYNEATQEEQAIINTNLGFTDGFDYNKISGWCKTAFAYLTSDNELANPVSLPPTLFLWGTSDTLTQSESLAKIAEIKRGGTICDVISYESANHGAMCSLSAGTSFNDAVNWFITWG